MVDPLATLAAIIGSNVVSVTVTSIIDRKRAQAAVDQVDADTHKTHTDSMRTSVETALMIEERAAQRYDRVSEALDVAQLALNEARAELAEQRAELDSKISYIGMLHRLLDDHDILYPPEPTYDTCDTCATGCQLIAAAASTA